MRNNFLQNGPNQGMQQQYGPGDKMSNLQVPHPQSQQQPPTPAPRGVGPQTPPKSPQNKPSPGPFPEQQRLSHEQVMHTLAAVGNKTAGIDDSHCLNALLVEQLFISPYLFANESMLDLYICRISIK